jgi:hypothetical protein
MEIYKKIERQSETILAELHSVGLSLVVTGKNSLRIKGAATQKQIEHLRKWKAQLINQISPKCSNCTVAMELIHDGTLWFCPFGCESQPPGAPLIPNWKEYTCKVTSVTSVTSESPNYKAQTTDVTTDVTQTAGVSNVSNVTTSNSRV